MSSVTIKDCNPDIAKKLRDGGVSRRGSQWLEAADILDRAGILDHLLMIHKKSNNNDLLDIITKSVEVGKIISGSSPIPDKPIEDKTTVKEPTTTQAKPLKFGA